MEPGNIYLVELTKQAEKDFRKYSHYKESIDLALKWFKTSPNKGPNIKKMKGSVRTFRYRIGDLRMFYDIYEQEVRVTVLSLSPRGDAYKLVTTCPFLPFSSLSQHL